MRFADDPAVEDDHGIGADDDRVGEAFRDRGGLGFGVAFGQLFGRELAVGKLPRRERAYLEGVRETRQEFPAARRKRSEDELHFTGVYLPSAVTLPSAGAL